MELWDYRPDVYDRGQSLDLVGYHVQATDGIAGLGEALRSTLATRAEVTERVAQLRDRLLDGLVASVPDLIVTAAPGSALLRRGRLGYH